MNIKHQKRMKQKRRIIIAVMKNKNSKKLLELQIIKCKIDLDRNKIKMVRVR